MNIYFLNIDLGLKCTGIENSALLRAELFSRQLNINPKFIISKYRTHQATEIASLKNSRRLPPDVNIINVYDIAQKINRQVLEYKEPRLHIDEELTVSNIEGSLNKKFFNSSGSVVMYFVYDPDSGLLIYINRFYQRKIWRRDNYDCLGFISRTQFLREKNNSVEKEIYYRPDATIAFIKDYFYDESNSLESVRIQIVSQYGDFVCFFDNENDFLFYFLSVYFKNKKGNHVLLVDKNRVFYDVSVSLKEKFNSDNIRFYVISAVHNLHVVNYNKITTSRLNHNYYSVFEDASVADAIIVQTELQKDDIFSRFKTSNIYVIPHTYENKLAKNSCAKRDCYKAVYFARYSAEKRHELAIQAFSQVVKVVPSATLHCYGFGPRLAELKKLVVDLALDEKVFLHGWCSNVAAEYELAGLSVVPSQSESFSLTIAESLAHGCPVVAFDVPYGPRELIQSGNNGYLVPFPDIDAMADKIINVMTDPVHHQQLSEGACRSSIRYSEASVAEQWKQLFNDLEV